MPEIVKLGSTKASSQELNQGLAYGVEEMHPALELSPAGSQGPQQQEAQPGARAGGSNPGTPMQDTAS